MKRPKSIRRLSGFTLAELIVVITILAILATIGFLALSGYSEDAKEASVKTNVRSVYTAINSESAITGNSPRYYVVHDTGAALSGAFITIDGNPVALTGGDWNVSGTNYSAGKPDFVKLKMNPAKFRISGAGTEGFPFLSVAHAANYQEMIAGAADVIRGGTSGRPRPLGFLQVAGVSPITKIASVAGNLPSDQAGNPMGLIKDPSDSATATGFVVDGKTIGNVTKTVFSKSCLEIKNAGA